VPHTRTLIRGCRREEQIAAPRPRNSARPHLVAPERPPPCPEPSSSPVAPDAEDHRRRDAAPRPTLCGWPTHRGAGARGAVAPPRAGVRICSASCSLMAAMGRVAIETGSNSASSQVGDRCRQQLHANLGRGQSYAPPGSAAGPKVDSVAVGRCIRVRFRREGMTTSRAALTDSRGTWPSVEESCSRREGCHLETQGAVDQCQRSDVRRQ
jgi:hypothetical protein